MRRSVALLMMFALTACATVQHGPVQRIAVDSEPRGALVETSLCGPGATKEVHTPGIVWVSRRAERCTLTFRARDHFPERVMLQRELPEKFFDNAEAVAALGCDGPNDCLPFFFLGAFFAGTGFAVDTATGALFEQHPRDVFVHLAPREP